MLHIIIRILAIIGIIILCLLGLLLAVLLSVLFVPVRYRAWGKHNENETSVHVRVTWFLQIVTAVYEYPDPGGLRIRIFGVPFNMPAAKGMEDTHKEDAQTVLSEKPDRSAADGNAATPKDTEDQKEEDGRTAGSPEGLHAGETITPKEDGQERQPERKNRKVPLLARLKKRAFQFYQKIKYTILSICGKIKKVVDNFSYYRDLILEEENRLLFGRARVRIGKVIRNIRPSRLKVQLLAGTGSPDTTGYLLALYSMFSPFLGNHIDITPDFERAVLQGEFYLKGRVTIFVLLKNGAGIYFDRQLHVLISKLKREDV